MHAARHILLLGAVGLMAGCHTYGPYGPSYGPYPQGPTYYNNPGMAQPGMQPYPNGGYVVPQGTMPGSGPYLPPDGTYTPGQPPTLGPGTTPPTFNPNSPPSNSGNPLNLRPNPGGNSGAPPFNSTPGGGDRPVPFPSGDELDDAAPGRNGTRRPALPGDPTGMSPGAPVQLQPGLDVGQNPSLRQPAPFNANAPQNNISTGGLPQAQPMAASTNGVPVQNAALTNPAAASSPLPHGFDKGGFTWLRGEVEYDDRDQRWHLVYSLSPEASDRLGGDIALAADARLEQLQNGDWIYVEGSVDPLQLDGYGKPCYRITDLKWLTPAGQ